MKIKKLFIELLIIAMLPILTACNVSDDVNEIFASGTWKLTNITLENSRQMIDLWGNDVAARQKSLNLMEEAGTFNLTFHSGETTDGVTSGVFDVQGDNRYGTGRWTANGNSSSRTLSLSDFHLNGSGETDIIAKTFLSGLQHSIRYSGDSQYLYIYYEEENQPIRCLWFIHPSN